MHLKALEIQGFKSFPDKTVLGFDASITAIVGPNGSGKSNISDAIRWVMGEQSTKALRGGKMEDVIFGGTEERKGLGFAQVSLTLDNEDGHLPMDESEIVVTRRYYRSGDSEYYINRHLVRLRDINELFMDTGLGQDGYSLIGQGKIDEILAVKSTQRREIFEEAAGISRFRHRKEEAERKLERTRENLLRINDKMEELELQIGPLREQAEKAKRYFACREQLRVLEVSLWMDRLERLRAQHQETRTAYEAMTRQLEQLRAETDQLYAQSEQLGNQVQEKEQEMEAARWELRRVEEEAAACQSRISVLSVRMEGNRERCLRFEEDRKGQAARQEGLASQIEAKQARLAELSAQGELRQKALADVEENLRWQEAELAVCQAALYQLEQKAQAEGSSTQQVQSLLSALDASALEVSERKNVIEEDREELQELIALAQSGELRLLDEISHIEQEIAAAGPKKQQLEAQLAKAQTARQEADNQWVALRMQENNLASRIRMLEDMEKLYEGYSKSVKTVLEEAQQGNLKGVHGPVAGLLKVPAPYAVAIEIALGGAMQNIVVDAEEDGKAVLSYLKRKDAGRVTCLPLGSMRPGYLQENGLDQAEGFVGIASQLISYDAKYEKVFANLLGRVAVVKDLDAGIAIARKYGYRFRIVTLDGQVLAPGGSMTGGSVNKKGGILSRAKELEQLRADRLAITAQQAAAQKVLEQKQTQLQEAQGALEAGQRGQRDLEHRLLTVRGQTQTHRAQIEELERQLERLEAELQQLDRKTSDTNVRREEAQMQMAQMQSSASNLGHERQLLETRRDELLLLEAKATEESRSLKMDLATFDSEARVTEQSLLELMSLLENLRLDHQRQQEEITRLELENQSLAAQQIQEEALSASLVEQTAICMTGLEKKSAEKLELEGKKNQAERDSRNQNEALLYCQRETAVLEQKKLSGEQEEAQILDKLWESYELSHEAALSIRVPVENGKETERKVSSLKGEIRGLGNVNLGAVEEFERVSERYDYLLTQRQDVEQAAENLIKIIEELTGEMKVIFKREFVKINQAFKETFLQLFQGGKAALKLEDEEDILNCGIEIQVQPPGKNLNNLSLLSGGEKAFVAIALYFAILKVRPTPFCVLDEIEAALDDANVLRFARYLRGISNKTQFIVITHRRGTMEEADVLYGVTMERQGVSKLLRLDLNEAEKVMGV